MPKRKLWHAPDPEAIVPGYALCSGMPKRNVRDTNFGVTCRACLAKLNPRRAAAFPEAKEQDHA